MHFVFHFNNSWGSLLSDLLVLKRYLTLSVTRYWCDETMLLEDLCSKGFRWSTAELVASRILHAKRRMALAGTVIRRFQSRPTIVSVGRCCTIGVGISDTEYLLVGSRHQRLSPWNDRSNHRLTHIQCVPKKWRQNRNHNNCDKSYQN